MVDDKYLLALSAFHLGMALFCTNQLLLHQRHQRVYVPLALFFVTQSVSEILVIVDLVVADEAYDYLISRFNSLHVPAVFAQPLLLWLYVRALTSEDDGPPIRQRLWHAVPILLAISMVVLFWTIPKSLFAQNDLEFADLSQYIQAILIYFQLVEILFYIQVTLYLILIMKMLSRYRARLKDLFATTEDRELTWVWWITTTVGAYLLISIAEILADLFEIEMFQLFSDASDLTNGLTSLAITWVIGIWGVRQQPGLMPKPGGDTPPATDRELAAAKYERSALTDDHAARIATKIERAMTRDMLYRDPNLSLWDLAKHISVTSNYVSQTLNMTLQSNFFDYVNKWRIQDAVTQLHDTDETILVIAHDVGFNSRSSFYNAFKREMNTTPSALRASRAAADPGR
ncbi:AraC family transcriptional regulator [Phaeobacter sp. S60]|uniref:helix-turn-helix domain-containing protein n=1 Tax=Phaeobacter sp. S60 TaxID=1569353 RepID=UPI00058D0756|nr:AraC family transcriptional regulator [Phaeobacter sp. S60]KII11837.1 transcriptional regulator [Phaeobacter sp. S60]